MSRHLIGILLILVTITGCSVKSLEARRDAAMIVAKEAGFSPFAISTDTFRLAGFSKLIQKKVPVTLYIEGDGFAWVNRRTVSSNPTPTKPMLLVMATMDDAKNVIYIARPCQYIDLSEEEICDDKYWTSHRFSEVVISSYVQILDGITEKYDSEGFHLVGFSGGGAIAVLLAARRTDVLSLRTIGGNLDHAALNKAKRVTPLRGSLNPIAVAGMVKLLPQIHYIGSEDKVVSAWVSSAFVKAVGGGTCAKKILISGVGHADGWLGVWRQLSRDIPRC